jgi:Protein of unknown function (DUF1559)
MFVKAIIPFVFTVSLIVAGVGRYKDFWDEGTSPPQPSTRRDVQDLPADVAALRIEAGNNLKQIGQALLDYEAKHKLLPPRAVFDKEGKPLLSWRVLILPYLGESKLYDQFHLDEPWDSDHNKKLIAKMPPVFQDAQIKGNRGETVFQAVVGPHLAFEGSTALRLASFIDGTATTIALVEVEPAKAVPWTKPTDWDFDGKTPLAGLAHIQPDDSFQVLCMSGDLHTANHQIDPDFFKGLLTRNGGEYIGGYCEEDAR